MKQLLFIFVVVMGQSVLAADKKALEAEKLTKAIETAIRDSLNKPEGELTKADFDELRGLLMRANELIKQKQGQINAAHEAGRVAGVRYPKYVPPNIAEVTDLFLEKALVSKFYSVPNAKIRYSDTVRRTLKLDLQFCAIKSLNGLQVFRNLKTLDLYGNQLTDVSGLEKLTQLRWLGLGGNQLTEAPKGLEKLTQLEDLWLWDNQLTEVPKELEKLTQLTRLRLEGNRLTDVKGLEKLTQLKALNLYNNPDLTKAQIEELQKALPKCKISRNPTK